MSRLWGMVVVVLLSIPAGSCADIYKCVSKDGITKFSDEPCMTNTEVAFSTPDQSFDHVIGNGSIYHEPVPVSRFDIEDLTEHAKKIGKCIITGERNNATFYKGSPGQELLEWYVQMNFGPAHKKNRYVVRLTYKGKSNLSGMNVWLDSFSVKMNGEPYDPSSMGNTKKFVKRGTGRWEIKKN